MNSLPHIIAFEGRVLPETRMVTLPGSRTLRYKEPNGFEGEFKIGIRDSRVRVECRLNGLAEDDVHTAAIRAAGFANSVVDVVAFSTGWALQVILDTATLGEETSPISFSEMRLAPLCTSYSLSSGFEEVCEWVLTDLTLRFAFNDLVRGISGENYPLIASARAIEAIRHLIAGPNVEPKKGWPIMRAALRIEVPYLRAITDASTNPRHGARGDVSGALQLEMLSRAWTVMSRYLEYRKRGAKDPLPLADFPMLAA